MAPPPARRPRSARRLPAPAGDPLPYRIRRDPRAGGLRARVSALGLVVTCPPRVPLAEVEAFLAEHAAWARDALARLCPPAPAEPPAPGTTVAVLDRPYELVGRLRPGRPHSRRASGRIEAAGPDAASVWAGIEGRLRAIAREDLGALTAAVARRAGRTETPRISIRDPATRWGSCTPGRAAVSLSWRLVLAPAWVAESVVAHEVAHLAHPDHSPAFWAALTGLFPATPAARAWLADNGAALRRWPAP